MSRNKRYGIMGAICVPIFFGLLVFVRGAFPFDSFMYMALQKAFYIPTIPLFWVMEKIMEACGIHGEEAMGFLIPMFLSMLIYWAMLGFCVGFLAGAIKEKKEGNCGRQD